MNTEKATTASVQQEKRQIHFWSLVWKTAVSHTLTYFLVGILAFTIFNYAEAFVDPEMAGYMRPTDSPIVALGPALQPIRGLLFAIAFYPLREVLFYRKRGWLVTWLVLVIIGIFSTFGPAPGSVEGLIYTTQPIRSQLSGGLLEVLTQSFLFSALLYYWVNNPERKWLNWILGVLFVLVIFMSIMGYLLT